MNTPSSSRPAFVFHASVGAAETRARPAFAPDASSSFSRHRIGGPTVALHPGTTTIARRSTLARLLTALLPKPRPPGQSILS